MGHERAIVPLDGREPVLAGRGEPCKWDDGAMSNSFWRHFCSGLLMLVLLLGSSQAHAATNDVANDAELGRRLKAIADSGRLHDPDYVGSTLGLHMVLDEAFEPDTYPCPAGGGSYQHSGMRYLSAEGGWYRPMPEAKAVLLANSGDRMKEYLSKHELEAPMVRLMVWRSTPCVAGDPEGIEASLEFEGLVAFACFGTADAGTMVDGIKHVLGTHGGSAMSYRGWSSEYAGSLLSFEYGSGSACAHSIKLLQGSSFGFLEQRTRIAFDRCMEDAVERYCATPAGQRKRSLYDYQLGQCHGSFDGFMQHQARTGRPPEPEPIKPAKSERAAMAAAMAAADAAATAATDAAAAGEDLHCIAAGEL
jgi:hypothetical protein